MEKMKVVSFTYCENVQNDHQGHAMIIGPIQYMQVSHLPTNYSFCFSLGVFNRPKNGFLFKLEFVDPDGLTVQDGVHEMFVPAITKEKIINNKLPFGLQINIGFKNIVLNKTGRYASKLYLNDKFINSYPIDVIL